VKLLFMMNQIHILSAWAALRDNETGGDKDPISPQFVNIIDKTMYIYIYIYSQQCLYAWFNTDYIGSKYYYPKPKDDHTTTDSPTL